MTTDATFTLFDLTVRVAEINGCCTCSLEVGDCFFLQGGTLRLPAGHGFCVYALQSTLPLLPAKQRPLQAADWMQTDVRICCPDPACGLVMVVERTGQREVRHDDVSATPLPADRGDTR
ncbi:MAG: TIGR04076 family protein [Chloroflexota bacterium]